MQTQTTGVTYTQPIIRHWRVPIGEGPIKEDLVDVDAAHVFDLDLRLVQNYGVDHRCVGAIVVLAVAQIRSVVHMIEPEIFLF